MKHDWWKSLSDCWTLAVGHGQGPKPRTEVRWDRSLGLWLHAVAPMPGDSSCSVDPKPYILMPRTRVEKPGGGAILCYSAIVFLVSAASDFLSVITHRAHSNIYLQAIIDDFDCCQLLRRCRRCTFPNSTCWSITTRWLMQCKGVSVIHVYLIMFGKAVLCIISIGALLAGQYWSLPWYWVTKLFPLSYI